MNPHDPAFARTIGWNGLASHEEHEVSAEASGISRLEYFAAAALTGMLACQSADFHTSKSVNVAEAFIYAEMMCAELAKRKAK